MKSLLLICVSMFVLAGAASSQETGKESQTEMFRKQISAADWALVSKDKNGVPYYVDSLTMVRFVGPIVSFFMKAEKKEGTEYTQNSVGCKKHTMSTFTRLFQAPGEKPLTGGAIAHPDRVEIAKGNVFYSILEYVCKNAKDPKPL